MTNPLTIDGALTTMTVIVGGDLDRVFHLTFGSSSLAIVDLTIQNGKVASGVTGGGIANPSGTLTVSNSSLSSNEGFWGGAITNAGSATLTDVTVSGNTANNNGGEIYNGGSLTLTNVTVSGKTATNNGGALVTWAARWRSAASRSPATRRRAGRDLEPRSGHPDAQEHDHLRERGR